MDSTTRRALADQLSELIVLAEPGDPTSLDALASALAEAGRNGEATDNVALTDMVQDAISLLSRIRDGAVPNPSGTLQILSATIDDVRALLCDAMPSIASDQSELLQEFVARTLEHLEAADSNLLVLEQDRSDRDAIDSVFGAFHTIKGMTGFLSLYEIQEIAHDGEEALEAARSEGALVGVATLDEAFRAVDRLRKAVHQLTGNGPASSAFGCPHKEAERDGATRAESEQPSKTSSPRVTAMAVRETVRVDAERLDQLLDAVGELVIAESMASRSARLHLGLSPKVEQQLGRLDKLTRQLHEMAGSLCMVPMRPAFQRLARAVRDVSRKSQKPVRTSISGAETELDRGVVDRIADPLLHLVRNAVDHGIESAEEREAAGKPRIGTVALRAYHRAGSIYVEVEDDGAGLDRESIRARARALGLIAEEAVPSDKELFGLLFLPGFSTSEKVTEVSGRGIGMDVVRRTVHELSGQVSVRSEEGRGTTITIRLPITLAVIDGMAVRVGGQRYIVPTLSVVRSVRPDQQSLSTVLGSGAVLQHEDELLRLIRISDLFSLEDDGRLASESIVMVVEDEGERAGLVIDEILGQQQIVIKPLGDALGEVPGISGGAVMPDGQVGLILDVEGLVCLANQN